MMQSSPHQNFALLVAYGLGKISGSTAELVAEHLELCGDCRQFVAETPADAFLKDLRDAVVHSRRPAAPANLRARPQPFEAGLPPAVGAPVRVGSGPISSRGSAPADPVVLALLGSPEYEVIRELGRGGMGVVYLIRNCRMDRLEVLKVVKTARLERPGAVERFEREMRAAARLNHQNIVKAYSSPRLEGLLAFAMEYVNGADLQKIVKGHGPLPISNACYYIHQAARALQHAHEKKMVHRDIKPNNLMLARDGKAQVVKILDFGLSKATSENALDGGLTGTGQVLGTPHYMAPEQVRSASNADIRADIYSLGCTLYYLISGKPPFKRKTSVYEVLQAQLSEQPPPLSEFRDDIPKELEATIGQMLAKSPAERYQQPAEVADALAPFFKKGVKPLPDGLAPAMPPPSSVRPELKQAETAVRNEIDRGDALPRLAHEPTGRTDNPATASPNLTVFEQIVELTDESAIARARRVRGDGVRMVALKRCLIPAAALLATALLGLWGGGAFDDRPAGAGTEESQANPPSITGSAAAAPALEHAGGDDTTATSGQELLSTGADHPTRVTTPPGPRIIIGVNGRVDGAIEGEEMRVLHVSAGRTSIQEMSVFPRDQWSGARQLWWTGAKPGERLEVEFESPGAGMFDVLIAFTMARDYAVVKIDLDGESLGERLDLYNFPHVISTGELTLGTRRMAAGRHTMALRITGANYAAAPAYMVGLDYLRLRPLK